MAPDETLGVLQPGFVFHSNGYSVQLPDGSLLQDQVGGIWVRFDDVWIGNPTRVYPVTVIYWGEEPTVEKETIVSKKTPQDEKPATVEEDAVRLLKLFGSLDLAQLADSFSEFDDWSQDRVHECVKFAIRCVEEPSKVGQERSTRDLKAAWSAFTDALKPLFDK